MNSNIQMMKFDSHTYESLGSFPEIAISTTIAFPSFKGIQHVDYIKLKKKLLEAVWESVSEDKESTAK